VLVEANDKRVAVDRLQHVAAMPELLPRLLGHGAVTQQPAQRIRLPGLIGGGPNLRRTATVDQFMQGVWAKQMRGIGIGDGFLGLAAKKGQR